MRFTGDHGTLFKEDVGKNQITFANRAPMDATPYLHVEGIEKVEPDPSIARGSIIDLMSIMLT